jgi:hypothetical protein
LEAFGGAKRRTHRAVTAERQHLALTRGGGVVPQILEDAGVVVESRRKELDGHLGRSGW